MAGTTGGAVRDVWTDHLGNVHERKPGADAITRCGLNMGISNRVLCPRPCQECIEDSLREYALTHDCKASGCVTAATSRYLVS